MSETDKAAELVPAAEQEQHAADEAERRRYFRVDDRVMLKYHTLAPEEVETVIAGMRHGHPNRHALANTFASSSQQTQHLLHRIEDTEPDIARFLEILNEKLDLLAQRLSLEASQMENEPVRAANISAAGICFEAQNPVSPGALVQLRLLLLPSYTGISAVGKVIRCEENPAEEPGMPLRIAVDFEFLPEDDRELLVQHVVKRETRLLRKQRDEAGD